MWLSLELAQLDCKSAPLTLFYILDLRQEHVRMAAYSAILQGASVVYVVDRVPERLAKAKELGCIVRNLSSTTLCAEYLSPLKQPIDFTKGDAVKQIEELNGGLVTRAVRLLFC